MDANQQAYQEHEAKQALWHGQETWALEHKWAEVIAKRNGQPLPEASSLAPPTDGPPAATNQEQQPPPPILVPYSPTTHSTAVCEPVRANHVRDIPGYPPSSSPLPAGIGCADLVSSYPNHLHGRVLLDVIVHFTPKEIAELCPAKEINRFMIASRVRYARIRASRGDAGKRVERKKKKRREQVEMNRQEAEVSREEVEVNRGEEEKKKKEEDGAEGEIELPYNGYRRVKYRMPWED